jgi:adenylosuccinate lyase
MKADLKQTQASFMEIFHNDIAKIDKLNEILCDKAGFPSCYPISVQTYPRKVDQRVLNALSGFGATVQKITGDIRHLASQKEMEEPFEKVHLEVDMNSSICVND